MILRLTVRNFKSFGCEDTALELVPASREQRLKSHVITLNDSTRVLRNSVIYGGNAAGKSNLIEALSFLVKCVKTGELTKESMNWYCKAHEDNRSSPTAIGLQFSVGERVYDYGIECLLHEGKVIAEWLYGWEKGCSVPLIVWDDEGGRMPQVLESVDVDAQERNRISVYAADFASGPHSCFFFKELCHDRTYESDSPLAEIQQAWRWMSYRIRVTHPDDYRGSMCAYQDEDMHRVADALSSFDTGICGIEKEEVGLEELRGVVPEKLLNRVQEEMSRYAQSDSFERAVHTLRSGKAFIGFELRQGWDDVRATVLRMKHDRTFFDFEFGEESDGTRRIFDFMDMLFMKDDDCVYVVDELNRSLHPMLTTHLVSLFNEIHSEDRCQMVFTTHEDALMSLDYFRRDEIWFVERRADSCSHLYYLDDFSVRSDASVGKQYQEGRYGGIPILSLSKSLSALKGNDDAAD